MSRLLIGRWLGPGRRASIRASFGNRVFLSADDLTVRQADEIERELRDIYGPRKPKLGTPPSFLDFCRFVMTVNFDD